MGVHTRGLGPGSSPSARLGRAGRGEGGLVWVALPSPLSSRSPDPQCRSQRGHRGVRGASSLPPAPPWRALSPRRLPSMASPYPDC